MKLVNKQFPQCFQVNFHMIKNSALKLWITYQFAVGYEPSTNRSRRIINLLASLHNWNVSAHHTSGSMIYLGGSIKFMQYIHVLKTIYKCLILLSCTVCVCVCVCTVNFIVFSPYFLNLQFFLVTLNIFKHKTLVVVVVVVVMVVVVVVE
jgi:hypothetical protein